MRWMWMSSDNVPYLKAGDVMHWHLVRKTDIRARMLADRHYSRQQPGTREFCPPGNSIVLIIPNGFGASALWCSHRPDPRANLAIPRADGYVYWDNPYFRNESGIQSSLLIREALAITRYLWSDLLMCDDGFHSFVNPKHVRPIKRRGEWFYGYCFYAAGFRPHDERTKSRNLIRYVLPKAELCAIEPQAPMREQMVLF